MAFEIALLRSCIAQHIGAALTLEDRQQLLDVDLDTGRQAEDDLLDETGGSARLSLHGDEVGRRQTLDTLDALEAGRAVETHHLGLLSLDVDLDGVRLVRDVLDAAFERFGLCRRRQRQHAENDPDDAFATHDADSQSLV